MARPRIKIDQGQFEKLCALQCTEEEIAAQAEKKPVQVSCSIGDESINGVPYADIVEIARGYLLTIGGFEKLAEWGLIR